MCAISRRPCCCTFVLYSQPGCSNFALDQVELVGLEPTTSCLQTTGSTSTRVHTRRSPSRSVYPRPSRSIPVAVLSCCTHYPGPTWPDATPLRCRGSPVRPWWEPNWADPGTATGLDPTVATEPGARHLLIFLFCR